MGQYVGPGNVPYIVVNRGDEADLRKKWKSFALNGYPLFLSGTYALTEQLEIPVQTSPLTVTLYGESQDSTIITEANTTAMDGLQHILCSQANWTNAPKMVLRNISFAGNNHVYKSLNLPFLTPDFETVTIKGAFKAAGAANRKCMYIGGAAAPARPCILNNIVIIPDNDVAILAELWLEGLGGGSMSLLASSANVTTAIKLHGTSAWFQKLIGFIGDGKTMGTFLSTDTLNTSIGQIYINRTGSGICTDVFQVDAGSAVAVQELTCITAFTNLFADATSATQTSITGSFNGINLEKVFTSVADGSTKAHGLGLTPKGLVCVGTIASQMIGVTAIDATNFTFSVKTDAGAAGTSQTVYGKIIV